MQEIWKSIEDYEGLYQVSNLGNVKSNKTGKILHTATVYNGYKRVCLSKKSKGKCFRVHRLVAQAFIPNFNNYLYINHKDGNKNNNNANNLEWCTQSYNIKEAYRLKLRKSNKGKKYKIGE